MQSLKQIIKEMSQTDPTIKTALQQSQPTPMTNLLQTLPQPIKAIVANYPAKIKVADYYISTYWPDSHFAQGKSLMSEKSRLFGGATAANGLLGMWENPANQLVEQDIFLIKSFTDAQGLSQNLSTFLDRASYWGNICGEQVIAVEIGNWMGSLMLLIPTRSFPL